MKAIDTLKHYAGKANELQALRDRVEELETVLGLNDDRLYLIGLTPSETKVLGILVARDLVTRETALTAIYSTRPDCDRPDDKLIDVYMVRIRKRLAAFDITIATQWGFGWYIDAGNKKKLNELVEKLAAERFGARSFPSSIHAGGAE